MENNIIFTELQIDEINQYSNIINNVFDEFVGKDYSELGNKTFKDFIDPKNILERYNKGMHNYYVAKNNKEIIGVLKIKNLDHISLFFVKKEFHGQSIGKKLIKKYLSTLDKKIIKIVTVNSSIYAEKIYSKLGFKKINEIQEKNGIKYIPMEYKV